jgi:hypothetical protein
MSQELFDELMKREPIQPALDFSSQVPNDYAVRKALQMLHGIGVVGVSTPRVTGPPPGQFNGMTRGYVTRKDPYAFLVHDGTYRRAMDGNEDSVKSIAGVLAHEDKHLKSSDRTDEYDPYQTQLGVLKRLKAPNHELHRVWAAQQQIAPRKR